MCIDYGKIKAYSDYFRVATTVSKVDIQSKTEFTKDRMSILYKFRRDNNNGGLKRGDFKMIHDSVLAESGINHHGIVINF